MYDGLREHQSRILLRWDTTSCVVYRYQQGGDPYPLNSWLIIDRVVGCSLVSSVSFSPRSRNIMEPEAGRENFLALFETPEDTKDGAGDTALLRILDVLSLTRKARAYLTARGGIN